MAKVTLATGLIVAYGYFGGLHVVLRRNPYERIHAMLNRISGPYVRVWGSDFAT